MCRCYRHAVNGTDSDAFRTAASMYSLSLTRNASRTSGLFLYSNSSLISFNLSHAFEISSDFIWSNEIKSLVLRSELVVGFVPGVVPKPSITA